MNKHGHGRPTINQIEVKAMIKHPLTGKDFTINELEQWLKVEVDEENGTFEFVLTEPVGNKESD